MKDLMRSKYLIVLVLTMVLVFVVFAGRMVFANQGYQSLLGAGAPQVVSYQGQVIFGRDPYNGTGYFKFAVINQAGDTSYWSNDGSSRSGGEPSLSVQLNVENGVFTVLLGDTSLENMTTLPASAFGGTERYLRLWFSRDDVIYTQLSPDQRIAAVPYALQAQEALNADTLDTFHASDFQQHYANVVVVAKSGGDYTSIQTALDSITDASETNPYLVWVAPGTYTGTVTMKQYVDIEGSGELATKITFTGSGTSDTGTVVGEDNAELRFLTVENTGTGDNYSIAIYNTGVSPRLTNVTAIASGATNANYGIANHSSSPTMTGMTATASGGTYSYGVHNESSSPQMTNVSATASGGTNSYGVDNYYSSPTMTYVTATASGGAYSYGIYNYSSSPTMTNVTATASGGTMTYGVVNNESLPTMTNVTATASEATNANVGVANNSSSPTMTNVTATASGGTNSYGIDNYYSSPTMINVTATASGGTDSNYGVLNSQSSPAMTNVTATASGGTNSYGVYNSYSSPTMTNVTPTASGGVHSYGVYNIDSSSPTMTGVTATASEGTDSNYGVYNNNSSPTMTNVTATALGGGSLNHGIYNVSSSPEINNSLIEAIGGTHNYGIFNYTASGDIVKVNNSQITASTATIYNDTASINVGASLLSGGDVINNGGSIICAGVYDEDYTFYASTCP